MDLFIELKNEFAAFRKDLYIKVNSFSKLICPIDDTIQNEEPRPSLQQEIIETELKSETSTYASICYPKKHGFVKIWIPGTYSTIDILFYRKDRGSSANSNRRGGGVLVAINKCFSSRKLDVLGLDLEAIWISDKLNHGKKMLLCVVHFSPSSHVVTSVIKPSTVFDGNDDCKSNCVGDLVKIGKRYL
ncbi:hypothetical protein AVEN_110483-1 [Araneus ventricosus]|uniref:Uncharacterized protein n=1 Tax=Araneus ventricosus TaxID=182803 RepID=A0A4Y2S923_ARAVE|nr:hypothetical protein AVEN_110483-1 [Araneus ventricosus]